MTADTSFSVLTSNNIETRRVRAGGVIFREGEEADELFVIKSGYVRIQIDNRMIADLTADSIFGEMALIDNEPRSATAVAITDRGGYGADIEDGRHSLCSGHFDSGGEPEGGGA